MKQIIVIITGLSLLGSLAWLYSSPGWEPAILALTSVAALLKIYKSKEFRVGIKAEGSSVKIGEANIKGQDLSVDLKDGSSFNAKSLDIK